MENDVRTKGGIAKKIIKILLKVLYQIFMVLCALLIVIIVFQKITDNNKSVAGYRIFRVVTGSMEPEYDIGEVVISKETAPEAIEVGNDIVYFGKFGEYNGKIIMHKVTQIDVDENGERTFHAKGLYSGSIEDPQIKASQIYGVVKFRSGILTVLYRLATSIYSSFIIVSVLVLNVFISFKFPGNGRVQQLDEQYEEIDEEDEEYDENDEDLDIEVVEEDSEEIEDESDK
ncbi:MAG: hypothetical protein IJE68_03290 [Clostridia bacterium]|nr:hypothetical protein [Clostridia bacterium]